MVGQDRAVGKGLHFLDAAVFIERQQRIFTRASQHFDRVSLWAIDNLLGCFLSLDHLHSQAFLGIDINPAMILLIEWVSRNQNTGAVGVYAFLDKYRSVNSKMINAGRFTSFKRLKIPDRGPDSLDPLNNCLVRPDIRHGSI